MFKTREPAAMSEQHVVTERPPRGISKGFFFGAIAIVAAVSFLAGTRGNEIMGAIAPIFGIKIETGTLDLSSVQKTYQNLKANFDGNLDTQKLIDGANRGLTEAAGDRYTVFMNAQEAAAFNNDLSGNIGGGIGAEIALRNGQPTIVRVLPGTPADQSGLMAGDVISKINDQSANGQAVDKVVSQIRGQEGTTVKIDVVRAGDTKSFTVTRKIITTASVESKVENGTGIMTISRFDDQTGSLARKAAEQFRQQNVKNVILDLRSNGGGYLTAAQDVAGLWLDNKVVVSERTGGKQVEELRSTNTPILAGLPTVVLVNNGTASASEIVAGALQDYGVAKLIGEKTFGKGSVQKVIPLASGAQLKVTIAKWYTPKGKNINQEGITPDTTVVMTADNVNKNQDVQLDAAKKALG